MPVKPARITYGVFTRTSLDLPVRLLTFKTALDLDLIQTLRRRLKSICGAPDRRVSIRRLHVS